MEQSKRNTETLKTGSAPGDGESRSGSGTRLCTGTSSSSMFSPHSLRVRHPGFDQMTLRYRHALSCMHCLASCAWRYFTVALAYGQAGRGAVHVMLVSAPCSAACLARMVTFRATSMPARSSRGSGSVYLRCVNTGLPVGSAGHSLSASSSGPLLSRRHFHRGTQPLMAALLSAAGLCGTAPRQGQPKRHAPCGLGL